jgi:hypothetical protein
MSSINSSEEKEKHQISQNEYALDQSDIVTPQEEKRIVRKIDFKVGSYTVPATERGR